ncbi:hypothetical protein Tco_0493843 [Tanacetum coccineum]
MSTRGSQSESLSEDFRCKIVASKFAYEAKKAKELAYMECKELEFLLIDAEGLLERKATIVRKKQEAIMAKYNQEFCVNNDGFEGVRSPASLGQYRLDQIMNYRNDRSLIPSKFGYGSGTHTILFQDIMDILPLTSKYTLAESSHVEAQMLDTKSLQSSPTMG